MYVVQNLQTEARTQKASVRILHRPIKEESKIKPKEEIEKNVLVNNMQPELSDAFFSDFLFCSLQWRIHWSFK
jgi:hypothetical protein